MKNPYHHYINHRYNQIKFNSNSHNQNPFLLFRCLLHDVQNNELYHYIILLLMISFVSFWFYFISLFFGVVILHFCWFLTLFVLLSQKYFCFLILAQIVLKKQGVFFAALIFFCKLLCFMFLLYKWILFGAYFFLLLVKNFHKRYTVSSNTFVIFYIFSFFCKKNWVVYFRRLFLLLLFIVSLAFSFGFKKRKNGWYIDIVFCHLLFFLNVNFKGKLL